MLVGEHIPENYNKLRT